MPTDCTDADGALADKAWRGYDPRAAVPRIAIATIASAALLAGRWYLDDLTAALVPYAIVLALWPSFLALPIYRCITYTYRLTDRALLVDRGFLSRPEPPVWFKDVATVETGKLWLGIGWVNVVTADGRALRLTAIRHPEEFAKSLNDLIAGAKV